MIAAKSHRPKNLRDYKIKFPLVMKKTPVALFTYNRPSHTQYALESLNKCRRKEECDYFFFSDGARTQESSSEVSSVRQILRSWAEVFDASLIFKSQNVGLAHSIVSGVSELCRNYGRVIVLEDDLIIGPDFLHFMIESLNHYENEERVMQVSGCTLSLPKGLETDAFFLPVSTTWGWATWQRAWEYFSWTPVDFAEAKRDDVWCQLYDLNGAYPYSVMLEDCIAGRNNSWGILWWYAVSRQGGLVVYPRHNLVWNEGFDGSGVHCGNSNIFNTIKSTFQKTHIIKDYLTFPDAVQFDPMHLYCLEEFLRSTFTQNQSQRDKSFMFKRVIKKFMEKLYNAVF